MSVAKTNRDQAHYFIAEIIALLCVNDSVDGNPTIAKLSGSRVVSTVLDFFTAEDEEIRYSGIALLLTLSNISGIIIFFMKVNLVDEIILLDGILILSKYLNDSTRLASQVLASKTILSLAKRGSYIN
jgi:hypothetical protein